MTISISTPATLDTIADLLVAAGFRKHASASAAGHAGHTTPTGGGFRRVFWCTPDNLLVVVMPDGSKVDCGDDGEGMVAGDEPVDDLGEAAAALGLRPDKDTLREFKLEAGQAGDEEMVKTIELALDGDFAALILCGERLADAAAQADD
jgi:hypothetical protein